MSDDLRYLHDPKAPPPARRPAPAVALPEDRLTRLGASPRALDAYRRVWDAAPGDVRRATAARLAVLTDAEVAAEVDAVDLLYVAAVPAVLAWCRNEPDIVWAVAVAAAVESTRETPRASLKAKLEALIP